MSIRFLCLIIYLGVFGCLTDILRIKMQEKEAKKHNYNCDTCGVWDCPNKQCRKHRE